MMTNTTTAICKLRRLWSELYECRRDQSGNVAILFALAVIPLFAAVGMALDISRASSARAGLQSALDATALALSKDAPQDLTTAQLNQKAQDYFNANLARPELYKITVTPKLTKPETGSFEISLTAEGQIDTTILKILGYETLSVGSNTVVKWGVKRLNLALVLDNTGSMSSSSKMTELKKAAKILLKIVKDAATKPDDVQVAIIPFNTDVNIGTSKAGESWLNWEEWDSSNGENVTTGKGKRKRTVWVPDDHSKWNGCVTDRDQDYDVKNTAPSSSSTDFVPHQASPCPTEMLALTSNWTQLDSRVDDMTPSGNTNITVGLAWGWQALTPTSPLNAPAVAKDLDKVIVMLTDGDNTQNRWSKSSSSIDTRTEKICENIKNDNIKIYTIRVIDGNSSLLRSCATTANLFYEVKTASELEDVFTAIAQSLANLRIAK
jgi:Flp pilus assembly protein TadG